jgi:hypothetical protein
VVEIRYGTVRCYNLNGNVKAGKLDNKFLGNIHYVVDSQGKKATVQLDLKTWNALLGYLEDLEDPSIVKENLRQLMAEPEKSGAVDWDSACMEW